MVEHCFNELSIWGYSLKTDDPIIFKKKSVCSGGGRVDNKYGNKPEYSNTAVDTHKQNNELSCQ